MRSIDEVADREDKLDAGLPTPTQHFGLVAVCELAVGAYVNDRAFETCSVCVCVCVCVCMCVVCGAGEREGGEGGVSGIYVCVCV
jgi:hypothetical protein